MATPTVVYDACVLFPADLRDLLVQLATTDLMYARWTDEIHEEWIRGVLRSRPDLTRALLERVRALMDAHVEHCLVADYQVLIPALQLPDPNDRHVLAAAIRGRADAIITRNLKHFPAAVLGLHAIEALHPDEFLIRLLDTDAEAVCAAVKTCRQRKRKPPKTVEEHLADLVRQDLPKFVAQLRGFADRV